MSDLLSSFPGSLRERTRHLRLGPAPAIVAHPDGGGSRAPLVLWLHGRTVSKEIDTARYARLLRAGLAVAAIDLPGHGERADPALREEGALAALLEATLSELDEVLEALLAGDVGRGIDPERLALGGVSVGGMIALRRLADPHPFRCAAVEAAAGDFGPAAHEERFRAAREAALEPLQHVERWRPLPLLALHSEADRVVPVAGIRGFVAALRERYARLGADPETVRLITWPETGAPLEHMGFGREAGRARAAHVAFLAEHLLG